LEVLGRFLGILEAKLEKNIVMDGFRFSGGPSWRRLGVVFRVFGGRFGLDFEAFRGPSAQQTEHAKLTFYLHSEHFGPSFLDFRTLHFTVLLALEGHFDCIFTVKSQNS
jgi:hypothetical protein